MDAAATHADHRLTATDTIRIFDTTLRDGEQAPGGTLTLAEKLEVARMLESMGVDVIEAGFPISSPGDFESVRAIAAEVTKSVVCGLARCTPKDIERAGEAVRDAKHPRIHLFLATSKIHREHKLRKGKADIVKLAVESVRLAKSMCDDVEFSPEDASRTEMEFLEEVTQAAVEAGATTINLPDTVGYATPGPYGEIFAHLLDKLPILRERNVVLSAHCHDDLGMAVANSLAAVMGGARQVECTINGIGERAGNAALEEIVMALRTRRDYFKLDTRIDATKIYPASRMVSSLTGLTVQRNKAVVGQNAFAHESGIHQDGVLKHRETYEIMDPATVGIPTNSLVMGKHSGRAAFRDRVSQLGYTLTDAQVEAAFAKFKALADKKKEVFDEDIEALVDDQLELGAAMFTLAGVQVTTGNHAVPTATVTPARQHRRDPPGRQHWRRPGRCDLRRHPAADRRQGRPDRLPHPVGQQGPGCPGRGDRGAGPQRQDAPRPRRQHRHPGGQRPGLPGGRQPAAELGQPRPHRDATNGRLTDRRRPPNIVRVRPVASPLRCALA